MKRPERVAELESQRRATAHDAKALMRRAVRDDRQLTPQEQLELNMLRRRSRRLEDEIQALIESA
jgi:hypothetical protein